MDKSILHIKAPHEIHIGAKVMAAQRDVSMNQYIVDLIEADMVGNKLEPINFRDQLTALKKASPKQKKTLLKAAETIDKLVQDVPELEVASEARCKGTHYMNRTNCGKPGCPWA